MSKGTSVVATFPVLSLLGVAFVVLKLCNVINWSWAYVLLPFWAPSVVFLLMVASYVVLAVLLPIFSRKK